MTYRIYLRDAHQRVTDKTTTASRDVALAAFSEMVGRRELDGQKVMACLTYSGQPVAYHRFDMASRPVMADGWPHQDYWRGKVDKIKWPQM